MAQLKEFKGPQIMQDQINVIILGFTESPLPEKRVIYADLQEEATESQGKFQVGDKVFFARNAYGKILTVSDTSDALKNVVMLEGYDDPVLARQLCHATAENWAYLSKVFEDIDWEMSEPVGDDLVYLMLEAGFDQVLCVDEYNKLVLITGLTYDGSLHDYNFNVYENLTAINPFTSEPLNEDSAFEMLEMLEMLVY